MPKANRGEIWQIDLGMAQKPRPCLVLSVEYLDHERAVVTYVSRTRFLGRHGLKFLIRRAVLIPVYLTRRASGACRW